MMVKNTRVQAAPIKRVLQDFMRQNGEDAVLADLKHHTGINHRRIYDILNDKVTTIEFRIADALVTHTFGPMLWYSDPELSAIYEGMNFKALDVMKPLDAPGPLAHGRKVIVEGYEKYGTVKKTALALDIPEQTVYRLVRKYGLL